MDCYRHWLNKGSFLRTKAKDSDVYAACDWGGDKGGKRTIPV
jgi:hypothetical protein